MLWPPPRGWDRIPRWLERLSAARGVSPDDLQLAYVRSAHAGTKVVWKDVSRGIAAAVLRDSVRIEGHRVRLIPNQTLYVLDASTVDDAHVLASLLNSTIVNVLAIVIAERAKDFHYRYFGRTIARIPLPRIDGVVRNATDQSIADLYGVTAAEHARLGHFLQQRLGFAVNDD